MKDPYFWCFCQFCSSVFRFLYFSVLHILGSLFVTFLHHKNDFLWVLLWKFLAFNATANSLHLFYSFFASLFLIFLFLYLLGFLHHKNVFFWVLLWKFLAFNVSADFLHLSYSFFASVFFILVLLYLLRCFANKNDFFWVFIWTFIALDVSIDSLHIFYTVSLLQCSWYCCFSVCYIFCTIKMIFLGIFMKVPCFWCFNRFYIFFDPLF